MTRINQDFEVYAGNTRTVRFTAWEPDPTSTDPEAERILNLTGHTLHWVAKRVLSRDEDDDPAIEKSTPTGVVITDAAGGQCEVRLLPADTENLVGSYYHELESTDGAGTVSTISTGVMTVKRSIA